MDWRARVISRIYGAAKGSRRLRRWVLLAATWVRDLHRNLRRLAMPTYRPPPLDHIEEAKAWADSWNEVPARPRASWVEVHPPEPIVNRTPLSLGGEYDGQYRPLTAIAPPAFLLEVPHGTVLGDGVVVGHDGALIAQVSHAIGSLRSFETGLDQETGAHFHVSPYLTSPPRHLPGTALVMSTFAGRGYFHWLFDVLPRLDVAARAGVDLSGVDYFIVNNYLAEYQIETLSALGVNRDRVVTTFRHPHLSADHLLVPSLSRERGVTPSWVCDFLRATFPPRSYNAAFSASPRIYINRSGTDHGRLPNEQRLVASLSGMGFKSVSLEKLTMDAKSKLFSLVEIVVGPSGAGLTNLVFARPGTVVVEACTRGYAVLEAWDIAHRLGMRYLYVPAEAPENVGEFGSVVPADRVIQTLRLASVI